MGGEWAAWPHTSTFYIRGDGLSFVFALLSLFPQLASIFMVCASIAGIYYERVIYFGTGILLNEILNGIIKKVVRAARPSHPCPMARFKDFGMPSSHGQFSAYALTIYLCSHWELVLHHPMGLFRATIAAVAMVGVAVSRVYNCHHSVLQVAVGFALGVACALCVTYVEPVSRFRSELASNINVIFELLQKLFIAW